MMYLHSTYIYRSYLQSQIELEDNLENLFFFFDVFLVFFCNLLFLFFIYSEQRLKFLEIEFLVSLTNLINFTRYIHK
jgi:hypothetical protein